MRGLKATQLPRVAFLALLPRGILQEAGKAEGVQQPQSLSAWKARPQRGFAHLVGPAPDTYIITSRSASLIKHQAPSSMEAPCSEAVALSSASLIPDLLCGINSSLSWLIIQFTPLQSLLDSQRQSDAPPLCLCSLSPRVTPPQHL